MLLQPFPVRPGQTNPHCLNDGKVRTLAQRNLSFLGVGRGLHRFNDELELRGYIAYCARQIDAAMARWKAPEGTFADVGDANFWLLEIERAGGSST